MNKKQKNKIKNLFDNVKIIEDGKHIILSLGGLAFIKINEYGTIVRIADRHPTEWDRIPTYET